MSETTTNIPDITNRQRTFKHNDLYDILNKVSHKTKVFMDFNKYCPNNDSKNLNLSCDEAKILKYVLEACKKYNKMEQLSIIKYEQKTKETYDKREARKNMGKLTSSLDSDKLKGVLNKINSELNVKENINDVNVDDYMKKYDLHNAECKINNLNITLNKNILQKIVLDEKSFKAIKEQYLKCYYNKVIKHAKTTITSIINKLNSDFKLYDICVNKKQICEERNYAEELQKKRNNLIEDEIHRIIKNYQPQ